MIPITAKYHLSNLVEVFFKNASIGIIAVNKSGEIISYNPFLTRLFGYDEHELKGKKIEVLIPHRFHNNHRNHRKNLSSSIHSRSMGVGLDLFGIKKNGSEFPVEVSLSSFEDNEEKFVFAFVNDISKRLEDHQKIEKLKEDLEINVVNRTRELTRTLSVLELLNEKLELTLLNQTAILDNARVMLYATNNDGIIQFFNPEATRITGYIEKEVVNKLSSTIFHQTEEIEKCRKELIEKNNIEAHTDFEVIKQKALMNEINLLECTFVSKEDKHVPVSLTITPIWDKRNQLTGFLGVAIDITENKKAQANLMEALSKEKKLGELKSRFVSMASHEFRTPLSTILSSAYLIEKYTECDEQHKREKHISRIISAVNNLTNILNDFLSVGKIEEGKVSLHVTDFNVKSTIEQLIKEVSLLLKKGQQIKYSHKGKESTTLDFSLLKNILINLMSNAMKFSPENKEISISSQITTSEIKICIKDSGIGISEEDQQHLMERFYRGANAINIQGTGLGLHIVSKYVERMNGKISFESKINEGTTFILNFKPLKLNKHEDNSID